MTFTDAETANLASQRLGRLATIGPDGRPPGQAGRLPLQPRPGTIDVTGFNMAASQKFRNVRRNGQAALVVDDIASADLQRVDFLEIRRTADAIAAPADPQARTTRRRSESIPTRILSFGIEEPSREPHLTWLTTGTFAEL